GTRGMGLAVLSQGRHGGGGGRGRGGLAGRKKGRHQKTDDDRQYGQPIDNAHRLTNFSLKNARISRSSTPASIKAEPIARTRINVSIPRFTFLSCAISSMMHSTAGSGSGIAEGSVGKPTSAKWRFPGSAPGAGTRPRRAENSNASTMPMAIASP